MLLNSYLHGIYWGIMKILIIRKPFKLRLSLMMTLNNEYPFQTTAKISSLSPYLKFTILLYKYRLPYLPTYHKFFCPNFFFWKKYGWRIPYLHNVWKDLIWDFLNQLIYQWIRMQTLPVHQAGAKYRILVNIIPEGL